MEPGSMATSSEWHAQVYDREQSRRMQRWMALRSKLCGGSGHGDGPRRACRGKHTPWLSLTEAIFRTSSCSTACRRERGLSSPNPEVTSRTPKVWLQYRGHGSRTGRLEAGACVCK